MNPTLIVASIRQRLASPLRMAVLAALVGLPLLPVAFAPAPGLWFLGDSMGIALVVAAGAIGPDVSAGVLQILFARPVRRSEYVLSRWCALGSGSALVRLAQIAVATLILAARGSAPASHDLVSVVVGNALTPIGIAAVLVMLSSLAPGLGDLGLYLLGNLAGLVLEFWGRVAGRSFLERAGDEVRRFLTPDVDISPILNGGDVPWFAIVSYLSTVTLCLAVAVVVMNRKELSYASG